MKFLSFWIVLILGISTSLSKNFFSDNILSLIDVFKNQNVEMITIFTCKEGSAKDILLLKRKLFSQAELSIKLLAWNQSYFENRKRVYYTREVLFVEPTCPGVANLLENAFEKLLFKTMFYWIFVEDQTSPANCTSTSLSSLGKTILNPAHIYINSQVFWIQSDCDKHALIFDTYRVWRTESVTSTYIGTYPSTSYDIIHQLPPLSRRRKNFHRIILRSAIAILFPKLFTYLEDTRTRHIDSFSKWAYPFVKMLSQDLNFRYSLGMVHNYGWDHNRTGRFDGFIGMLQRDEMDYGTYGMLMRTDRIPVVDFTAEVIPTYSRIIFRQPPLSSVSNIFVLPFNNTVWISCFGLCFMVAVLMIYQIYFDNTVSKKKDKSYVDTMTFISGAICQQGTTLNSKTISLRLTIFWAFVASLFLFTSYCANIVALLQTPSTSIENLYDLIASRLQVGVQDLPFNHVFLRESKSPATQKLYQTKILPKGDRAFMSLGEGLSRLQTGLYAMQAEVSTAYEYMNWNYTEEQKCGLQELETILLPMTTVPLQKNSPLQDVFRTRLRWQREVGLLDRTAKKMVPQKPKCESGRVGFASVGLTEIKAALDIILYGCFIAFGLFLLEVASKIKFRKLKRGFGRRIKRGF